MASAYSDSRFNYEVLTCKLRTRLVVGILAVVGKQKGISTHEGGSGQWESSVLVWPSG